ncbi:MAG: carbohydrate ABC transporter permease [Candidatus Melainabacteria bacterium]|nr:carbohydrate ABC transporter permease [Candidatus Melainabacteria bacterium]
MTNTSPPKMLLNKPHTAVGLRNGLQLGLRYGLLLLLTLAAIGPFAWLLSTALKSSGENIFAYPPRWLPEQPTLQNFVKVWQSLPMDRYFFNSLGVGFLTVALNLGFSVLAAYPLARLRFKGQRLALFLVLATMMVPFQVIMIPLYLLLLQLQLTEGHGLLASWLGLALPFAVSGFGIFFVRQALLSLPTALDEAARLDGCNGLQTLWYVLLPPIRPTLATLAVFTFMASWGEFLWPSILISRPENMTLPVGLVQLQGLFSADWRLVAAGTIVSIVPVLVFFIALQRYFVQGVLSGASKE